ncbi:MAG: ATP-binding cassette domain-containing protein [Bacteroidales bacterium]|nr:ATP-binding cassette domain-containing protein [Bacteroidales bacterium]
MNESVLKALMRLFALVANVDADEQTSNERDIIIEFLQQQFSNELVKIYIEYFDKYVMLYQPVTENGQEALSKGKTIGERLKELCDQLNEELTREQKLIVLINLLDYIFEDRNLTEKEIWFVDNAAAYLKVDEHEFNDLKAFTFDQFDKVEHQENLLFIDATKPGAKQKIKHIHNEKIDGRITVLHLVSANTFVMRYKGNETLLLNGHNLRTGRSYIWSPGSVVKNQKIGSIYYTWVSGKFIQAKAKSKFIFTAKNIEFSYGNSPNGLKRFTLTEESGRLIGIIGGSGSGKSTLLKVLCGNIKPDRGQIAINEIDIHKDADQLKGLIGYIPQDDFLIKELTVFQNLYYNAKLSFSNYTEDQISEVVETALIDFDLYEARDLKVGDSMNTFLSGGQRKRLNIALELMREPSILFVDEPTSGLSSADSEKVMNLLKRQTFKGKLIFANIHQPSSEIFKLLDKLLVMDQGGRVIYYGNPLDAIVYFKRMNNYVDAEESECLVCGNINPDQILRNVEARVVDVNGRLTRKRKTSPEEWYELYMEMVDPLIKKIKRTFSSALPATDFSIPSRWQQLKIFFKRDVLAKLANQQYILLTLVEAPFLAALLAFFTKSSRSLSGIADTYMFGENPNIPGFLFMSVIVALFLGMVISAEEIFKDRKILEREKFLNLSRSGYLNAKILVLLIISAIQMATFVVLGNYILEIKGMDWRFFLILFVAACWANMIGLNISAGFNSVVTIYVLVPLILVPQLLFSGVVIDFHNMNDRVKTEKNTPLIGDLITSRWAYEGLMVTQYKDNRFQKKFFPHDRIRSNASYIKSYVIPEIREMAEECRQNAARKKNFEKTVTDFKIINNEIRKIQQFTGKKPGTFTDSLTFELFSPSVCNHLSIYLREAEAVALAIYREATAEKDMVFEKMKAKAGGIEGFVTLKKQFYNRKVSSLLLNEDEFFEFTRSGDELIRRRDYIYTYPESPFGRAHYYAPVKKLGIFYIDTFWFNIFRILLTVVFLYLVLYFNLLHKLINYFENIRLRRINRRKFLKILLQSEGKEVRTKYPV